MCCHVLFIHAHCGSKRDFMVCVCRKRQLVFKKLPTYIPYSRCNLGWDRLRPKLKLKSNDRGLCELRKLRQCGIQVGHVRRMMLVMMDLEPPWKNTSGKAMIRDMRTIATIFNSRDISTRSQY